MKHKPQIVFTKKRNDLKRSDKLEGPWVVHKNGTKSPLWKLYGEHSIREDRSYNLTKSEQTFWNLTQAYDKVFVQWQAAFYEVQKVGKACAFASGKQGYDPPRWIRFEVHNFGESASIGHDSVDMKTPMQFVGQQRLLNIDVGTLYLEVNARMDKLRKYKMIAREILEIAFRRCCPELTEVKTNGLTKVIVNGRDYYFNRKMAHSRYTEVTPLYFAGDGEFMEIIK